jgi:hypothetical protein
MYVSIVLVSGDGHLEMTSLVVATGLQISGIAAGENKPRSYDV